MSLVSEIENQLFAVRRVVLASRVDVTFQPDMLMQFQCGRPSVGLCNMLLPCEKTLNNAPIDKIFLPHILC